MWLSNTATAALMTPMSNAVFIKLKEDVNTNCNFELHDDIEHPTIIGIVQRSAVSHRISTERPNTRCYSEEEIRRAATAVDLSIAYAASLGGMATLTGTGSNIVLQGTLLTLFGTDGAVSFLGWMVLFAPLALLNLIELWLVLMCCFTTNSPWNNTSVDRLRSSSSEALTPSSLHLPSDIPRHRSSQAGHTNTLTRHVKERDEEAPLSYPQKVVVSLQYHVSCYILYLIVLNSC
jgi:di/tricarboxylate transporter